MSKRGIFGLALVSVSIVLIGGILLVQFFANRTKRIITTVPPEDTTNMPTRLSYQDSCRALQNQKLIDDGDIPPLPARPPRYDDNILGVEFFRTSLTDAKLEHMTLSRTFFGRSEIRAVSFRGSDLSESTANWNDFIDVDFGSADLSRMDFRACTLTQVRFTNAKLASVDFRHCTFTNCDFSGADLTRAKMTKKTGTSLQLTPDQQKTIAWQTSDGDEPGGG